MSRLYRGRASAPGRTVDAHPTGDPWLAAGVAIVFAIAWPFVFKSLHVEGPPAHVLFLRLVLSGAGIGCIVLWLTSRARWWVGVPVLFVAQLAFPSMGALLAAMYEHPMPDRFGQACLLGFFLGLVVIALGHIPMPRPAIFAVSAVIPAALIAALVFVQNSGREYLAAVETNVLPAMEEMLGREVMRTPPKLQMG